MGLYIGMVLVVGQFVRGFTSGAAYTIMFDELPNVNRLMKLCKDLYFVREHEELKLEEDLFSRLIFLYRSAPLPPLTVSHVVVALRNEILHFSCLVIQSVQIDLSVYHVAILAA